MGGLALVVRTWLRPSARSLIGLVLLGGLENAVDDLGLAVGDTLDLVGVPADWRSPRSQPRRPFGLGRHGRCGPSESAGD